MRIALVGPGRAGQSISIAVDGAGHDVTAVVARDRERATAFARRFDAVPLAVGEPIPPVDLVMIAVRDGAIGSVADRIAPVAQNAAAGAVHVSGATPVSALRSFEEHGVDTGAFHPLQTMPTPELGARRLGGAWIAITAGEPLHALLSDLALTMGCRPFDLDDRNRAAYHAAAAAAANFPIAALAIAKRLLEATDVPFDAAQPLVDAVVANAFELGPDSSLTGPIARGDTETVERQLAAVRDMAPEVSAAFVSMVEATASVAGLIPRDEEA